MPAWPDVVGHGAVGREETLRMPGGCAPLPVVRALPRQTMGVLTPVMQKATLAVCDPGQDLPLGRAITLYFLRDDDPWHVLQGLEQRAENLLRRVRSAAALHEHVEHVLVLIDDPTQGMPFTMDGEEDLVQMPCVARLRTPPSQPGASASAAYARSMGAMALTRSNTVSTVTCMALRALLLVRLVPTEHLLRGASAPGVLASALPSLVSSPPAARARRESSRDACS